MGGWFPVKLMHWFASAKKDKNLRAFIDSEYKTLYEKPEKGFDNCKNTFLDLTVIC